MLAFLGRPPAQRTQEARVLETAREMYDGGLEAWLVPRCNAQVRLHKPPLAYWFSAGSFRLFGVSEWAGRLPMALAGWLTVGVVYVAARWLFNARAALFAAASLAGAQLFFRHARLAETDLLVTLFVTAGVYWAWRALASGFGFRVSGVGLGGISNPNSEISNSRSEISNSRSEISNSQFAFRISQSPPPIQIPKSTIQNRTLPALAGIATGLAILAKGPPAAFVPLFVLALAVYLRDWRRPVLWAAIALPIAAAIGLPWFLYVRQLPEWAVVREELRIAATGYDHYQYPWYYLPYLLAGPLPFSGFVVLGAVAALAARFRSPKTVGLLLWIGAVLLPLLVMGNKQSHYLLPVLPPLAILAGWVIDRGLAADDPRLTRAFRSVLVITLAASAAGALALPILPLTKKLPLSIADSMIATAILLAIGGSALLLRRDRVQAALLAYAAIVIVLLPVLMGAWLPSLSRDDPRALAAAIRRAAGDGPLCFYGQRDSLTLCFALRTTIPIVRTPQDLQARLAQSPHLVVITQEKSDNNPPPLPPDMRQRLTVKMQEQTLRAWRNQ